MVLRSNITSMKRLNPRSKFIFSYTLEKKKSNCSKNDKYQLRKKVTKRKLGGGSPKVLSPMVVPLTQEQKKHWYFEKYNTHLLTQTFSCPLKLLSHVCPKSYCLTTFSPSSSFLNKWYSSTIQFSGSLIIAIAIASHTLFIIQFLSLDVTDILS